MKVGRPKLKKPKTITITTRVDEQINDRINEYCYENGIESISDFLRSAVMEKLNSKK